MKNIDKFVFPGLLLLFGISALVFGIQDQQTAWFKWGGAALLLAGIVTTLFQAGRITRQLSMILGLAFLLGSVVLGWMNYRSVAGKIEDDIRTQEINQNVIQGLKDLRTAQIAFKNNHGAFTDSPRDLTNFVKNGELRLIKAEGQVPDTLTEMEALELGIITRDTVLVNAMDSLFLSAHVQEDRIYDFNIDSMLVARFSGGEHFKMKAGVVSTSGRRVPVIQITEPAPLNKEEPLMVGDIERATTAGNWKGVQ